MTNTVPVFRSCYKIRDKNTGLYSPGGSYAHLSTGGWNKHGKVWITEGHVRAHLAQYKAIPNNWIVVEFMMQEIADMAALAFYQEKV